MSKGTKHRPIRIPDELWAAVKAKAAQHDTTASEIIRALLTEWVRETMSDWKIECDHTNAHTTYEDAELWQGVCDDCGAELENDKEEPTP